MLKVIYTETGQYLESISETAQDWVTRHRRLSGHAGRAVHTEVCTASILLPMQVELITTLARLAASELCGGLTWAIADSEHVEVAFSGVWLSASSQDHEGAFIANVSDRTARTLCRLWRQSTLRMSPVQR